MNEIVVTFLKNQGLNEKDTQIYLDIFEHGQAFASSIALRTKIDRTTVYSVLKRLLKRGLLVQSVVNEVAVYIAVSPEIFVRDLDREMEEIKVRKGIAAAAVVEMAKLAKSAYVKPKTRVYEGDKAIVNLYQETLVEGDVQKAFINLTSMPGAMKDFLKKRFISEKIAKKVFSKVLVTESEKSERYKTLDKASNRESRIVKAHPFNLQSEIILFNGCEVAMIDFNKQIHGIVVESETFYATMEAIFDYIWESVG